MKTKNIKTRLILNEIEINQLCEGRVIKNNQTSGKINAPKEWIGKEVYILLKPEK